MRAEHRQFKFPFLYDGETQEVAAKYGPTATPHVFVFDEKRMLRYQGRVDSNPREAVRESARRAERDRCGAVRRRGAGREDADRRLLDQVARQGHAAQRRGARQSARSRCRSKRSMPRASRRFARTRPARRCSSTSGRPGARPCTEEFPDLQNTYRMYRKRPFELVTVSINYPDEEAAVRAFPRERSMPRRATCCRARWIRTS